MAATGTTPSELLIDINNIIRSKNKPNSITPDTHSGLLDNLVKVLSANTYVNQGIFIESASTITFTNNSGGTFDVTGITSENTYLTGGTYIPTASTITLKLNGASDVNISGITNVTTQWTDGTGDFSIKAINDSGLQSTGDYSLSQNFNTLAAGSFSHAEGYNTQSGYFVETTYQPIVYSGIGFTETKGITVIYIDGAYDAKGEADKFDITLSCYNTSSYNNWTINLSGSSGELTYGIVNFDVIDVDGTDRIILFGEDFESGGFTGSTGYTITSFEFVDTCGVDKGKTHSEGDGSIASGETSHAEGQTTLSSGLASHSEGISTKAIGDGSHSEGQGTLAGGLYSHAEGQSTSATTQASHSEGIETSVTGLGAHAEGYQTLASGNFSHAEGLQTLASGNYSHAEGENTESRGDYSHAEGSGSANRQLAEGRSSHVEGEINYAGGIAAHAEGRGNSATANYSHAEGSVTNATGEASHAEGTFTNATGEASHAEGRGTDATGIGSHAEGYDTNATGDNGSHAEGRLTTASGQGSHAEGLQTLASGNYSHSEGYQNTANGDYSHVEGQSNTVDGRGAHGEGYNTTASGNYSHAEGDATTASEFAAHAEGTQTVASGSNSHAEGGGTEATGTASHAQNNQTKASGFGSHAGGNGTTGVDKVTASGNAAFAHQHVNINKGNIGALSDFSAVLGGEDNNISGTSISSAVIGGSGNKVYNTTRSVVLGGTGLEAVNDDTVYVPNLNINNVPTGTSVNLLGVDSNGNVIDGSVNVSPTTLIVSNNGDNTTAEKGSLVKQYSTLVYAANEAVSGDTIYVMAGDYSLTDADWSTYGGQSGTTLYRDGVTWYFEPGSVVTNEISKSNNPCIFYVTSSNQSCEVYGRAKFINQYENVDAYASLINGFNDGGVGSDLVFECQDFDSSIFYYGIWVEMFKNADIKIHGTIKWKSSWGMTISPADTVEAENLSLYVNHVDNTEEDGFYPLGVVFWTYGNGGALTGHTVNFEFNTIESMGNSFAGPAPMIWLNTDNSIINVKGKKYINTRTDGGSNLNSILGIHGMHNSKVNIHIDDCIATTLRTTKSLIMLHNNDSAETTENNHVTITGRYEALQGSVLSTNEGGAVYNSNTYVLNGEFISNTQYVANFEDNNADIEIGGELRCNYTGSTGYGIRSIVSDSNILLRDLEIVTQGADAINSSVATEIDIVGTLTTNTDVNSNVTLRGIHNLNNIAKPDDLTVRGREILSQTVGTISTTGSTLDWSLSNNFDYTLATGTTFTFTGDTDGQTIVMSLTQDGTGGHTVAWPAGVKWAAGGTEPTMTSASGSTDVYTLIKINGTVYGSYIQDFQ